MIGQPNATITIPVLGNPTFDPYTGEPVFPVTSNNSVLATLEETSAPRELPLAGVNNPIAYLEGRIEGFPPVELKEGQYYDIAITLQNQIKFCRFYIVASPSSRMGLDDFFGKAIAGYLTE
jgi:hypothetical protein